MGLLEQAREITATHEQHLKALSQENKEKLIAWVEQPRPRLFHDDVQPCQCGALTDNASGVCDDCERAP